MRIARFCGRRGLSLIALATVLLIGAGGANARETVGGAVGRCPTNTGSKPPGAEISGVQTLQFELMRRSSFNSFDGTKVARDLINHRSLWCGAMIDRLGGDALIKLRDLNSNSWNVDTLYVLSSGAGDAKLDALARSWRADSITWVGGQAAARLLGTTDNYRVLEVWWD
jgi:hypothetical protein